MSAFTITPSVGSLTQIPGSPFLTGGQPFSVAIDPADRFAYINAACCKSVSGFRIDPASGALTAIGTFPAGTVPQSPAVDLTGKFLYVPDALSDDVFGYAINSSTGALTRVGTIPTGTNPVWVAITAPALSKRFEHAGGAYIVLYVCATGVFCVPSGVLTLSVLDNI